MPGLNEFNFSALDSLGQSASTSISLRGTQPESDPQRLDLFSEVLTASFAPEYGRTSFHGENDFLLFDGGNSMIMVHHVETGHTVTVALPQTGEFADLSPGEPVSLAWQAAQARCFAAADRPA